MLTQTRLKEILNYCPETGIFTRLVSTAHRVKVDDIAGSHNAQGYIRIGVDNKIYLAHRLAWLYMTGSWPANDIDHINTIRDCNAWANLREATKSQNKLNAGMRSNNTSGFKGVTWHKAIGKWQAQAKLKGKNKFLGSYDDPAIASEIYQAYTKKHHGQFYRATA